MTGYNLIDIEASGLDIESYPIEVGLLFNSSVYTWLIKPEPKWQYWDDAAEKIHGISRQHLLQHGMDAKQAAIEINELVKNSNGLTALQYLQKLFLILVTQKSTIKYSQTNSSSLQI